MPVPEAPAPEAASGTPSFIPPPDSEFDWIQLVSDEWLKGTMKVMQDDTLEFDSEELDLQEFDWEDVKRVRLSGVGILTNEDRTSHVGRIEVDEQQVIVQGAEGIKRFPRSDVMSLTSGEPKEINYWTAKASLGLSFRSGNTDQTDFTAKALLQRRTPLTRAQVDYIGNFGSIEGQENINNHRATAYFDYFLNRRLFWRPVFAEYFRDPFQNIAHRVTAGTGLGYTIVDGPKATWDIAGGPAVQYTVFSSYEADEDPDNTTPAAVLGTTYDVEISKRIDYLLTYSLTATSREAGLFAHHFLTSLELELTDLLDLDITFTWDRIEEPIEDSSGVTPEKNDFRLTVGLAFDM